MKITISSIFLILISSAPGCFADDYNPVPIDGTEMSCFEESSPVKWSFCITRVPESKNFDILYHFHGRNGNATWWNDKTYHTGKIHAVWGKMNADPPTVISISFGKLWLLTGGSPATNKELFSVFIDNVIPKVESKVKHPIGERMLIGISMGGVNTLLASLKKPSIFSKAAVLCSSLPTISHHASWSDIYNYYKKSSMSFKRAAMKYYFSRKFFPNKDTWDKNNPVEIIKSIKVGSLPSFYITCGEKDDWDCMDGSKAIVSEIKKAGGQVEWHPRPGGHCDIDQKSLAAFLVK